MPIDCGSRDRKQPLPCEFIGDSSRAASRPPMIDHATPHLGRRTAGSERRQHWRAMLDLLPEVRCCRNWYLESRVHCHPRSARRSLRTAARRHLPPKTAVLTPAAPPDRCVDEKPDAGPLFCVLRGKNSRTQLKFEISGRGVDSKGNCAQSESRKRVQPLRLNAEEPSYAAR